MGISLTKPKAQTVINQYLANVPHQVLESVTAQGLYSAFYQQATKDSVDVFADMRLERKFRQVAKTPQELRELRKLASEVRKEMQKAYKERQSAAAL